MESKEVIKAPQPEGPLPTKTSIALYTNPIYKIKLMKEMIGFMTDNEGDNLSVVDLGSALYINKPINLIFQKYQGKSDKITACINFSFKGDGSSREIMEEFLGLFTAFATEYTENDEYEANDVESIVSEYARYLHKTTGTNPINNMSDTDFGELLDELATALEEDLKHNKGKILLNDYANRPDIYVTTRYITGCDGILNIFYTIWKYYILSGIRGMLKRVSINNNVTLSTDDMGEQVMSEVVLDFSMLPELMDVLCLMLSNSTYNITMKNIDICIKTQRLYSSDTGGTVSGKAKLDSLVNSQDYIPELSMLCGIIPNTMPKNATKKLQTYEISFNSFCKGMGDKVRSADYCVVFDNHKRWWRSDCAFILDDAVKFINTNTGADIDVSTVMTIKDNVAILTPQVIENDICKKDNKSFEEVKNVLNRVLVETYEDLFSEVSLSIESSSSPSDKINGLLNDLMVQPASESMKSYLDALATVESEDFSDFGYELRGQTDIGEDSSSNIKLRDVFSRETVKVINNGVLGVDSTTDLRDVLTGFSDFFKENGTDNRPPESGLKAIGFNECSVTKDAISQGITEEQTLYDFRPSEEETISTIWVEDPGWSMLKAMKQQSIAKAYQTIKDKNMENRDKIFKSLLNLEQDESYVNVYKKMEEVHNKAVRYTFKRISNECKDKDHLTPEILSILLGEFDDKYMTDLVQENSGEIKTALLSDNIKDSVIKDLNIQNQQDRKTLVTLGDDVNSIQYRQLLNTLIRTLSNYSQSIVDSLRTNIIREVTTNQEDFRTLYGIDYSDMDKSNENAFDICNDTQSLLKSIEFYASQISKEMTDEQTITSSDTTTERGAFNASRSNKKRR